MPTYYKQLDEKHLLLIGKIIAECGYLESTIQALIWKIAKIESINGRAITTHMSLKDKLHALCALSNYHFYGKEIDKEIQRIAGNINKIATERNSIVHNPWASTGVGGVSTAAIFKARGRLKVEIKEVSTKDLESLLDKVSRSSQDLYSLIEEFFSVKEPE